MIELVFRFLILDRHVPIFLQKKINLLIVNWTEGVEKLWRMSNVFEGYERQYCELSANLSKKCTAATALNGGTLFWFFSVFCSVIDDY